MTAPVKIDSDEIVILRSHYEGIAYNILRTLWHRKWLIAGVVVVSLAVAAVATLFMEPRYTSEAMIRLNFSEGTAAGSKSQPIALLDANTLVNGATRIIRSRPIASAVVTRLGLDKDPAFARQPFLLHLLSQVRSVLGLPQLTPSRFELAVDELIRQIKVTNAPHSYLISIALSARAPDWAAKLANSVAVEYLRSQMLEQMSDEEVAAERERVELSSVYGPRHPTYLRSETKLQQIKARLKVLRDGSSGEEWVRFVAGQSLILAHKVTIPSGTGTKVLLIVPAGVSLLAGTFVLLRRRRRGASGRMP
jgi:uncharacterized protein involved in exopolysaccharide biosynthesis